MSEEIKPDKDGNCTRAECFYWSSGKHGRCTIRDNYADVKNMCPAWIDAQLTELAELKEKVVRLQWIDNTFDDRMTALAQLDKTRAELEKTRTLLNNVLNERNELREFKRRVKEWMKGRRDYHLSSKDETMAACITRQAADLGINLQGEGEGDGD